MSENAWSRRDFLRVAGMAAIGSCIPDTNREGFENVSLHSRDFAVSREGWRARLVAEHVVEHEKGGVDYSYERGKNRQVATAWFGEGALLHATVYDHFSAEEEDVMEFGTYGVLPVIDDFVSVSLDAVDRGIDGRVDAGVYAILYGGDKIQQTYTKADERLQKEFDRFYETMLDYCAELYDIELV